MLSFAVKSGYKWVGLSQATLPEAVRVPNTRSLNEGEGTIRDSERSIVFALHTSAQPSILFGYLELLDSRARILRRSKLPNHTLVPTGQSHET